MSHGTAVAGLALSVFALLGAVEARAEVSEWEIQRDDVKQAPPRRKVAPRRVPQRPVSDAYPTESQQGYSPPIAEGFPQPRVPSRQQVRPRTSAPQPSRPARRTPPSNGEESVDLGSMDFGVGDTPKGGGAERKSSMHSSTAGATSAMPGFKVFFDFNLINRPGTSSALTFDNYHSYLFFELIPTPDLQFSFDIISQKFYELDYQVNPKLQLRFGKIWIPFDDLSPHNIFGGRVNVSKLAVPGAAAFLPDIWTDLGVGFKYTLADRRALGLNLYGYVVNGFRSGGEDPTVSDSPYPKFGDLPTAADNNRNKAFGGRLHALFGGKFGFGTSYYTGQWSDDGADPYDLSMLGFDGQIRIRGTEFRAGIVSMVVNLPPTSADTKFLRGGTYVELGQKFGSRQQWKLLGRAGSVQLDDRVIANSDQQIVGGTLLWQPGMIQYSVEYSRDLKVLDSKVTYSYTALRLVMAF